MALTVAINSFSFQIQANAIIAPILNVIHCCIKRSFECESSADTSVDWKSLKWFPFLPSTSLYCNLHNRIGLFIIKNIVLISIVFMFFAILWVFNSIWIDVSNNLLLISKPQIDGFSFSSAFPYENFDKYIHFIWTERIKYARWIGRVHSTRICLAKQRTRILARGWKKDTENESNQQHTTVEQWQWKCKGLNHKSKPSILSLAAWESVRISIHSGRTICTIEFSLVGVLVIHLWVLNFKEGIFSGNDGSTK